MYHITNFVQQNFNFSEKGKRCKAQHKLNVSYLTRKNTENLQLCSVLVNSNHSGIYIVFSSIWHRGYVHVHE